MFDTFVFVSREAVAVLNRSVGSSRHMVFVNSAVDLQRRLAEQSCVMVVLDPAGARPDALADLARMVAGLRIPLVFWADRTASNATRVLAAASILPVELVFRGTDDGVILRAALRRAESVTAPARLLSELAEQFSRLPDTIQLPAVALFSGVDLSQSAERFVEQTRLSGNTVERRLRDVGLCGVKRLVDAARMARAYGPLAQGKSQIASVAIEAGYNSVRTLRQQYHRIIGMPLRDVRRNLSIQQFVSLTRTALIRPE